MHSLPAQLRSVMRHALLAIAIAIAALTLASCGGTTDQGGATVTAPSTTASTDTSPTAPTTTATASTTSQAGPSRSVKVYFADSDALQLVEETRTTTATGSDLRAALVELAKGPSGTNLIAALPPGTAVVGTDVRGTDAFVNLSAEFVQGYPGGGAAAEFAVLAPLVFTTTAIDGVERVHVTVDGQTPAPTGSQYDWSAVFSRDDFPDVTAGAP